MKNPSTDVKRWARLMGRDLERTNLQPLQPVRFNRNRTFEMSGQTLDSLGFSKSERLRVQLQNGQCLLWKQAQGGIALEKGKLTVSERMVNAFSSTGAILIGREGEGRILPVTVQEHPPDVLGPRFIDQLDENCIVRHAIPGLPGDGWTSETLQELEELLCSEQFRVDPRSALAEGGDWVGWMTRNRILKHPAPGDDELSARFVNEIFCGQQADGSWGGVPATGYAILRLLALGDPASDERIQRAAEWLLDLPEPQPRPGMWMLTAEYLEEWMSKRQPKERRAFEAGDFQWTGPDRSMNFFSWDFPDSEQDQFRAQEMQQVIPTCARHHPPACEPRITHISALVAEALIRCGYADHPRLRRYLNTVFHVGGEWGYWCGCGALGLYDSDLPASQSPPDLDVRKVAEDGAGDLSPWRWVSEASECALLANQPKLPERGTHVDPFYWCRIPGEDGLFALVGTAWQNGDCWAKTNRALSQHPSCPGSLAEHLAIYQASRYQTSLGEWEQGFPAGMLAFLSLYNHTAAKSLVMKTVPWLREHQADDGLWHHEELPRSDWGKPAHPPEPRLATYHIVSALHKFGLMDRLRP